MSRLVLLIAAAAFVGSTLVLAELRWFRRPRLVDRLVPYAVGGMGRTPRASVVSVESFRDVVAPLAGELGGRLARALGVEEELGTRLRRIHATDDATRFRTRQLAWSAVALAAGTMVAATVDLSPAVVIVLLLGGPVLAFLVLEQRVALASSRWQHRVLLELPLVSEQLAMLLSSGYSLGGALDRLARRGSGAIAADLGRVVRRTHQGLAELDALREWAELADVDAIDRFVAVLALNQHAADLGPLIAEEARSVRRDVHRDLIATIERRNQQVWIPVTVAALVPGVILMAVPFVDALRAFSGG